MLILIIFTLLALTLFWEESCKEKPGSSKVSDSKAQSQREKRGGDAGDSLAHSLAAMGRGREI